MDCLLIVASYGKDGKLLGVAAKEIKAGAAAQDVKLDNLVWSDKVEKLKAMLVKSGTFAPLCNSYTYPDDMPLG